MGSNLCLTKKRAGICVEKILADIIYRKYFPRDNTSYTLVKFPKSAYYKITKLYKTDFICYTIIEIMRTVRILKFIAKRFTSLQSVYEE